MYIVLMSLLCFLIFIESFILGFYGIFICEHMEKLLCVHRTKAFIQRKIALILTFAQFLYLFFYVFYFSCVLNDLSSAFCSTDCYYCFLIQLVLLLHEIPMKITIFCTLISIRKKQPFYFVVYS